MLVPVTLKPQTFKNKMLDKENLKHAWFECKNLEHFGKVDTKKVISSLDIYITLQGQLEKPSLKIVSGINMPNVLTPIDFK